MKMFTSKLALHRFLAVVLGILPTACPRVPTTPTTPASCRVLDQALVGTWISTKEYTNTGWRFPGTFSLDANEVYSSGDIVGLWTTAYAPPQDFCDILFVGDSAGLIRTTYVVDLDGDYLVLDIWGSSESYYRVGGDPPPPPDCEVAVAMFRDGLEDGTNEQFSDEFDLIQWSLVAMHSEDICAKVFPPSDTGEGQLIAAEEWFEFIEARDSGSVQSKRPVNPILF